MMFISSKHSQSIGPEFGNEFSVRLLPGTTVLSCCSYKRTAFAIEMVTM
ncbi:MAG: hypothetical protein LBF12_05175 [Christensenellaceae bacterium]|nr:hypothetical protein [Christensenellaceae bacterium]